MIVADTKRREADMEILSLLVRGEKEIAAGAGHDLDEVMADVDEILKSRHDAIDEQRTTKRQEPGS